MKFLDDHLIGGLIIGVTLGLHFGASLSTYLPLFIVLTSVILLRYVAGK